MALVGGGGSVRSREGKQRSEGEGGPESEGEVRGGRGCVASREGPGKEEAARQGGGGLIGRARASTQLLPLERGRRQGGSSGGGLGRAGPVLLGHQVGFTGNSRWFCSLFFFNFLQFVFDLF